MEIILKNVQLRGYHGVTELENITGTDFCIDILIRMNELNPDEIIQLSDTIDYGSVFELLRKEFSKTELLLETLSTRIMNKIFDNFLKAEEVEITILKLNAPIIGFDGKAGIKMKKKR